MMVLSLGGKGYSCAQIVILGGLMLMGRENPDLVRAMGGLAQGVGNSGNTCGALAGGACLIALHTAKGHDGEMPLENGPALMDELVSWFQDELCNGGPVTCDAILERAAADSATAGATSPDAFPDRRMQPALCGGLVAQVWEKALTLLQAYGIDPTEGRS